MTPTFNNLKKILKRINKNYPIKTVSHMKKYNWILNKYDKELELLNDSGACRVLYKVYDDSGKAYTLKVVRGDTRYIDNFNKRVQRILFKCNSNEWNIYNKTKNMYPSLNKFLLEPIAFFKINFHEYIIFPIINICTPKLKGKNKKIFKTMCKLSDIDQFHNWSLIDDTPIIYDYNIWEDTDLSKEIDKEFDQYL